MKLDFEVLRTVPGIQGFIILQKLRSIIIYIRESDVISSTGEYLHVGTPNDRSAAKGPVTRYRHFDFNVIFFGPGCQPMVLGRWHRD